MESSRLRNRLTTLEDRVRLLEDQAALLRLIGSWGPAADIGNGEAAAALWTEDAVLEFEGSRVEGSSGVLAMIESDGQQSLVRQGCAHVQGLPIVNIEGDHATATNYSQVYLHTNECYEIWRVSANKWEFRRTADGWRVTRRTASARASAE